MKATNSSSACQRLVRALIAASLVASGGCAQLPRMHPSPGVKEVTQLGSAQSFSAPEAAWPGDGWWHVYEDPQLDALIEEALRESPDLELAQARLPAATARLRLPVRHGCPRSPATSCSTRASRATTT